MIQCYTVALRLQHVPGRVSPFTHSYQTFRAYHLCGPVFADSTIVEIREAPLEIVTLSLCMLSREEKEV